MKIGVITFWYGKENYGMMLQCWALQQKLKQLGHSPFVIRFKPANRRKGFLGYVSLFFHALSNLLKYSLKEKIAIKKRNFDAFRENNIDFSLQSYSRLEELKNKPPEADCYIAGSDQIWAQSLSNPDNKAFFLDFGDIEIKRIAYAPSFAMEIYPSEYKEQLRELLEKFDCISCREYDGIKICAEVGKDAIKVLDPTMLLDKQTYLSLLPKDLSQKHRIFIYSLNISEPEDVRWKELKKYAINKQMEILVTPSNGYFKGKELFEDVQYSYATISGWLANIYNSKLVVTPSFHGIVFSILFERDFIFIPLEGECAKGNNRIFDLLKDLGLENRILFDNISYDTIIQNTIDWENVKNRMNALRKSSLIYLIESLRK